jgi:hypothetical protein
MPKLTPISFLVPTRWRGNAFSTRQRRVTYRDWTLARPEWVPTPARENQKYSTHKEDHSPEPKYFRSKIGSRQYPQTNPLL